MNNQPDPLAHASEIPDISSLITEFEYAQNNGPYSAGKIAQAEDTRYNRWPAKSSPPDGCRWQKNSGGVPVRPWDGRPDLDVNLADELCAAEVDIDMTALAMAHLGADTTHVTPITAAQVAELAAVGRWIKKATAKDRRRGEELLSQMKVALGWAVLNPGWLERWGLVTRHLTMDEFIQMSVQSPEGSVERQLPVLILDPDLEEAAVDVMLQAYPHIKKRKAQRIVRELRDDGETDFLDKQLEERRPYLRVLIPGYNLFISGGAEDLQDARGVLIVERFYQAQLESLAGSNGWNPEFVEAVVETSGQFTVYGERLRLQTENRMTDAHDRGIEIWTTMVRQIDEETGAAGIYCTTFSPHLKPSAGGDSYSRYFAKHYLLDYAHGQYPLCQAEREVIGPSVDDSRGVPEMVRGDQMSIKKFQDAQAIRAQWEVSPAQIQIGPGWSKVKDAVAPGANVTLPPGCDLKSFGVDKGDPRFGELMINRIENGSRRRFALPNTTDGSHPSLWQMRQMRNTRRWLSCWEEAYWQMAVLCYQDFSPDELNSIIGRYPQLTLDDLLHHRVTLTYDPRALDQDWTKTVLDFIGQLLVWDKGGLIDTGPLIQIGLSYIDPTIIQSALRSPAGAQAALYRQVEQDIASIMDFNPPQLREMDASAGMQLQMAFAVIGKNPKYQATLRQVPEIQESYKTYVQNLQHNVQETEISPVQGRLGVAEMPQRPVQQGQLAENY